MLGRIRRQQQPRRQQEADGSIHGVGSLIGGSGVSLDGQSLMLPDESINFGHDMDEVSSINTSVYGGGIAARSSTFRVVGSIQEPSFPPVPLINSPASTANHPEADTGVPTEEKGSKEQAVGDAVAGTGKGYNCGGAGGGWLPGWLTDSPSWLKAVMVFSVVLLVGAAALISVAAVMKYDGSGGGGGGGGGDGDVSNNVDGGSPSVATPDTLAPSVSFQPSVMPFPGQTPSPTTAPTLAPASDAPSSLPSDAPTVDPGPSTVVVTFYATAGRYQGDDLVELTEKLPNLPNDNGTAFMINLGDWNSPFATSCDKASFEEVDALFSSSPVPVYMTPGDNEYNDCPNVTSARQFWYEHLLGYETKYWDAGPFNVSRQGVPYKENFAFFYEDILFVGINLVGGTIHDADEWAARQAADLEWIDNNFEARRGQIELLVLFAHADPDIQTSEPFYTPFFDRVQSSYKVPTILVHRNLGIESSGFEPNYNGIDGLIVLVVEGSVWPPMKIEVSAAGSFTFDQATWFDDEVGV